MYAPAPVARPRHVRAGLLIRQPPGFGDYGLRIRLPRFIRKFQFGRFLRRTALPIAAGGVALKFGFPILKKGVRAVGGLFRRAPGTAPSIATPEVAPPDQAALDAAAAATRAAMQQLNLPPIPGATMPPPSVADLGPGPTMPGMAPEGPEIAPGGAPPEGAGPLQAGLFGGEGGGKSVLLLSAIGFGLWALSRPRR